MNKEDEEFLKRLFYWENGIRVTYIDIDDMHGVGEKGDVDRFIDIIENLIKENKELKDKYSRKLIDFQKEREEYERDYIQKSKVKEIIKDNTELNAYHKILELLEE